MEKKLKKKNKMIYGDQGSGVEKRDDQMKHTRDFQRSKAILYGTAMGDTRHHM